MRNIPFNREDMLARIQNVMLHELTSWQQTVLHAIYFDGKKQADIAEEYGVNRSAVCRALKRAEARIRRFLTY